MTARLIYANTNLQFFHCRGGPTFSTDVVGDDALHRPAMLTSATSSQSVLHGFVVTLTLGPSFSVRPENEAKDALKNYVLDNLLLPTHIGFTLHERSLFPSRIF